MTTTGSCRSSDIFLYEDLDIGVVDLFDNFTGREIIKEHLKGLYALDVWLLTYSSLNDALLYQFHGSGYAVMGYYQHTFVASLLHDCPAAA